VIHGLQGKFYRVSALVSEGILQDILDSGLPTQSNLHFPLCPNSYSILCCILFGFFLGRALTCPEDDIIEDSGYNIELVVILSDLFDHLILWCDTPDRLCMFLKERLGIYEKCLIEDMCESRVDMGEEELLHDFESLIEIESSCDRFKCIGEDIWILMASCDRLTT
jgi:hypothetical protein